MIEGVTKMERSFKNAGKRHKSGISSQEACVSA